MIKRYVNMRNQKISKIEDMEDTNLKFVWCQDPLVENILKII